EPCPVGALAPPRSRAGSPGEHGAPGRHDRADVRLRQRGDVPSELRAGVLHHAHLVPEPLLRSGRDLSRSRRSDTRDAGIHRVSGRIRRVATARIAVGFLETRSEFTRCGGILGVLLSWCAFAPSAPGILGAVAAVSADNTMCSVSLPARVWLAGGMRSQP